MSKFIFRGKHERLKLEKMENSNEQEGLSLPNIGVKADSLLIKQMCKILSLPIKKSYHLYWLGWFLRDSGFEDNFPELADLGHTQTTNSPLHQYLLDTFLGAVGRGEVRRSNLKASTTKSIYKSKMNDLLMPPKVD